MFSESHSFDKKLDGWENGVMKRGFAIGLLAVLLTVLTGCTYLQEEPETKIVTTAYELSAGMTLHVDTTIRDGVISVLVTDENSMVYYDEELIRSFDCSINVYRAGTYIVTATWEEARGDVEVYLTQTDQSMWPVFSHARK